MTIGIIGFGALGRQILGLLRLSSPDLKVLFFDDGLNSQRAHDSFAMTGYRDPAFSDLDFYVGLGYKHLRLRETMVADLRATGRRTPSFIHPSCHVHPDCRIGDGCLVYPLCNLDQEVELGHGVVLHNSVTVSHNSHVGDATYVSPGVVLSGHVTIGARTFIGAGTVVANNRRIGNDARVGLGSAVSRDIADGASAIGNPMRLLKRPLNLE